ncbi:MAG: hypothetical protein P8010_06615 [Desulfosarcinaceae bacterium]
MIIKVPHSTWRQYNREELCAEFDISAEELARCAEKGLVLLPPPRHKGPPYNELDHLRLRTYKRCVQSGYGLEEVLDLIGRLHRRSAPIRTLILAKAYADEKLEELKSRMAGGDTLELINLRCDADILQAYIDDLTRLQSDEHEEAPPDPYMRAETVITTVKNRPAGKKPSIKSPAKLPEPPPSPNRETDDTTVTAPYQKRPIAKQAPRAAGSPPPTKARVKPKRTYPRTHGSLEDESRQLWRRATPGGYLGWAVPVLLILAIVAGYIYLMPRAGMNPFSGTPSETASEASSEASALDAPLDEESISSEGAIDVSSPSSEVENAVKRSESSEPAPPKNRAAEKVSLSAKAASDLEKIMAASGKTAAATGNSPPIIQINELVVFYDTQTRILRAKIELLKNLAADVPTVIGGRIFMVLRPMVDKESQGTITLPRIPLSATDMADFFRHGVAFSLEDQKTTYLKTQLSKPPASQQLLSLYVFDNQQNLLLRETTSIEVKQTD